MVLESLFNPFTVKNKPWEMFVAGFIYSIVAFGLSYVVFREAAGLLMIFLIVMAVLPLLYSTVKNEEQLELEIKNESSLLKEHTKVIAFLMFLFFGITLGFVMLYIFLPTDIINTVFAVQHNAISNINNDLQGTITGNITKLDMFSKIFMNNLKVLFFCILFSFIYGVGFIFILTWNSSVIATAIGSFFKIEASKTAAVLGSPTLASYFSAAATSFFRYMTHGIFEIAAYFVAGLAGGIISIALIKRNLKEDKVLTDVLDLILISIGILLVAGIVEIYITPMLF